MDTRINEAINKIDYRKEKSVERLKNDLGSIKRLVSGIEGVLKKLSEGTRVDFLELRFDYKEIARYANLGANEITAIKSEKEIRDILTEK